MFESAAVLIWGSGLGLLAGRKSYAWIVKSKGDSDVSTLTLEPSSPHTEDQFSE